LIPIYLLSLGIFSGTVGAFLHQLLADQGYVPSVSAGFAFLTGASLAVAALQIAYRAVLRFMWPTSSPAPLLTETISMAACVLLVPYLADVEVQWPHPALERVEPAVYFAAFALVHLILKGISFFTLLRSWPGTRWGVFGWGGLAALCGLVSLGAMTNWANAVEAAKPMVSDQIERFRAGNLRLDGRFMREGAVLKTALNVRPTDSLLLLWSAPPEDRGAPSPKQAYVTVRFAGGTSSRVEQEIEIKPGDWTSMLIAAEDIPEGTDTCSVSWHAKDVPSWRTIPGLEPVTKSNLALVISEPLARASQSEGDAPSILLITIDGLSADHIQSFGYERETTPNLTAFGRRAIRYPLAYTVSADAEAAIASMLTGRDPVRHGFFGTTHEAFEPSTATLPQLLAERGYFTLAMTEGARDNRFDYESGFDDAIDQFDDGFADYSTGEANTPLGGSAATIWNAEDLLRNYSGVKFFIWLRLTELQTPQLRVGLPEDLLPETRDPSATDVYDTVLKYLDIQLGEILRLVTDTDLRNSVCVVLMGTNGRSVNDDPITAGLTEDALHVPLMIYGAGIGRGERELFVQSDDVGVTLAAIAGLDLGEGVTGRNLLAEPVSAAPVSVLPNPLRLSTRGQRFRLVWNTEAEESESVVGMFGLQSGDPVNPRQNPYTVQRIMAPMQTYLESPLERGLVPVNLPQN
jgi:hypothetical protein